MEKIKSNEDQTNNANADSKAPLYQISPEAQKLNEERAMYDGGKNKEITSLNLPNAS